MSNDVLDSVVANAVALDTIELATKVVVEAATKLVALAAALEVMARLEEAAAGAADVAVADAEDTPSGAW